MSSAFAWRMNEKNDQLIDCQTAVQKSPLSTSIVTEMKELLITPIRPLRSYKGMLGAL